MSENISTKNFVPRNTWWDRVFAGQKSKLIESSINPLSATEVQYKLVIFIHYEWSDLNCPKKLWYKYTRLHCREKCTELWVRSGTGTNILEMYWVIIGMLFCTDNICQKIAISVNIDMFCGDFYNWIYIQIID